MYYDLGEYEKALECMNKALQFTAHDDYYSKSLILTNRAEVYFKLGDLKQTEYELRRALKLQKRIPFNINMVQTSLNMALLNAQQGRRREASALLEETNALLNTVQDDRVKLNAYTQIAETYFVLNDSLKGLRYLLMTQEKEDSLNSISNSQQTQQLLVAYDTERLQQHNENLKLQVTNRNWMIFGSLAIALLLVGLLIMIIRIFKYRQTESKRRERELSQEIDHKNRQLTSYTIDVAALNEFHNKIKKMVDDPEVTHELNIFNEKQLVNDDFRIYFDEVHPDFLNKLLKQYPVLSKTDLRLCAYLLLGMSTKEIAALTFREIRSVESSRNRLRKKLNLSAETSLQSFLLAKKNEFNA